MTQQLPSDENHDTGLSKSKLNTVVLHAQPTAQIKKLQATTRVENVAMVSNNALDDDTDSDGMDCLVANESLQFSAKKGNCKRKSPPQIRKITKQDSFVKYQTQRRSGVGSFCPRTQPSARLVNTKRSVPSENNYEKRASLGMVS